MKFHFNSQEILDKMDNWMTDFIHPIIQQSNFPLTE